MNNSDSKIFQETIEKPVAPVGETKQTVDSLTEAFLDDPDFYSGAWLGGYPAPI